MGRNRNTAGGIQDGFFMKQTLLFLLNVSPARRWLTVAPQGKPGESHSQQMTRQKYTKQKK